MVALAGIGVVIGCVVGGFLIAGGQLAVLVQPAEYIVIAGSAIGTILIANGPSLVKRLIGQLASLPKSGFSRQDYIDMLVMMYELLNVARKDGVMALEGHIEHPEDSPVFTKYPTFAQNPGALAFLCDTMRLIISGSGIEAHDLDDLMEVDLETHHHESSKPASVLQWVSDALPGLGIVAAVLGVVITMGAIDGPIEEIGHHVAAALTGTFLGVLLAYGFVGPVAKNLANKVDDDQNYLRALKLVLLAFHKGSVPSIAVEFARRSLPHEVRPGFTELEEACRAAKAAA